jgi:phage shock protein A
MSSSLGGAMARFFRGLVNLVTLRFLWASRKVEDSRGMMGLQYDQIIEKYSKDAKEVQDAIGGLEANRQECMLKMDALTKEIEELENEMAGAQALAEEKVKQLIASGKTQEEAFADGEVRQWEAHFQDAESTVMEKKTRFAEFEQQVKQLGDSVDNYVLQAQRMVRDIEKLRQEKHEAIADVRISQQMEAINSRLSGLSTGHTDDQLRELRDRVSQAKGRATAAQKVAGTDMALQREKLRRAAQAKVSSSSFRKGISLPKKDVQESAPQEDTKTQLPES